MKFTTTKLLLVSLLYNMIFFNIEN